MNVTAWRNSVKHSHLICAWLHRCFLGTMVILQMTPQEGSFQVQNPKSGKRECMYFGSTVTWTMALAVREKICHKNPALAFLDFKITQWKQQLWGTITKQFIYMFCLWSLKYIPATNVCISRLTWYQCRAEISTERNVLKLLMWKQLPMHYTSDINSYWYIGKSVPCPL